MKYQRETKRIGLGQVAVALAHSLATTSWKRKISVLSSCRGESDYVVQYNFYDATQLQFFGEVAFSYQKLNIEYQRL